jgi:hypothetical protein
MISTRFFNVCLIVACTVCVLNRTVQSRSTGASNCSPGKNSMVAETGANYHTDDKGALSAFGTSVVIGGATLIPETPFQIATNQDVSIVVQGRFRGLMVRLEAKGTL